MKSILILVLLGLAGCLAQCPDDQPECQNTTTLTSTDLQSEDTTTESSLDLLQEDEEEATSLEPDLPEDLSGPAPGSGCFLNGSSYSVGEEFYNGCKEYCICQEDSSLDCFKIKCPTKFGLDVLSPNCIRWDYHEDFEATPPSCCPPMPTCLSTGECEYKNETFVNFGNIPMNLTGCENRCYCEDSEVICQDACNPLSANPPRWLPCQANRAIQVPDRERPCCLVWDCSETGDCSKLPYKMKGTEYTPVNSTHVSIRFSLPEKVSGFVGHLQVQFSGGVSGNQDPSQWPVIKFEFPDSLLPDAGQPINRVLGPLAPDTQYFIKSSIFIQECEDRLISDDIKPVRTPGLPVIETETVFLNLQLTATQVSSKSARISWRHFSMDEKSFVDGVQVQYWKIVNDSRASQVPLTSPLLHRDTTYHQLEDLEPDTTYKVNLDVVQVEKAEKEMYSDRELHFTTKPFYDVYDFDVLVDVLGVTDYSAVISWTGPPKPEQKYVSIFRILYYADGPNIIEDEISLFKLADADTSPQINITSLSPDTQYKLWIEAYLTNGKVIKSNVADFSTSVSELPDTAVPSTSSDLRDDADNDYYYKVMVATAIIASFAVVAFLILLYFYMHQNITYTVTMNKPSKDTKKSNGINNDTTGFSNSGFKGSGPGTGNSVELNSIDNNANGSSLGVP